MKILLSFISSRQIMIKIIEYVPFIVNINSQRKDFARL